MTVVQHFSVSGTVQKFSIEASHPAGAEPPVPYVFCGVGTARARGATSAVTRMENSAISMDGDEQGSQV